MLPPNDYAETLLAIKKYRSVLRAGIELGITQSSTMARIRTIEKATGSQMLVRYHCTLTDFGQQWADDNLGVFPPAGLTDRETDVVLQLSTGKHIGLIARTLFVTQSCVKAHITNIYKKTGLNTHTEIALWAHGVEVGKMPACLPTVVADVRE